MKSKYLSNRTIVEYEKIILDHYIISSLKGEKHGKTRGIYWRLQH